MDVFSFMFEVLSQVTDEVDLMDAVHAPLVTLGSYLLFERRGACYEF